MKNSCKTMPNATEWQAGALQAWKLAAETMARAGKHAVISSQNSFPKYTPYLGAWPSHASAHTRTCLHAASRLFRPCSFR